MFSVISRHSCISDPHHKGVKDGILHTKDLGKINRQRRLALAMDIIVGVAIVAIGALAIPGLLPKAVVGYLPAALVGFSKTAGIAMVAGGGTYIVATVAFNICSKPKKYYN